MSEDDDLNNSARSFDKYLQNERVFEEDDASRDSYEEKLDKEIEANCEFKEYIDRLDVEEKTNEDFLGMDKQDIIDFKNYQIKKYKAYISSLEKEKQDLIDNFKETTNILIERIKELEEHEKGERPQTAIIMNNIKKMAKQPTGNNISNKDISKSGTEQDRCVKCKKYFLKVDFAKHSLECLRKPMIQCKACKENIDEENKQAHINKFRDPRELISSIKSNDVKLFENFARHGFDFDTPLDTISNNYAIHYIAELGNKDILTAFLKLKPKLDHINKITDTALIISAKFSNSDFIIKLLEFGASPNMKNSEGETALFYSVKKNDEQSTFLLLKNGADVSMKNALGETAIQIAQQQKNDKIEQLLIKFKSLNSVTSAKSSSRGNAVTKLK